jgi:hypothetical protein
MGFIAEPTNFTERKLAFIDLGGSGIGLKIRRRRVVIDGWLRWDRRRSRLLSHGFNLSGTPPWPQRLVGVR